MRVHTPMRGGASGEESLVQSGTRSVGVGALPTPLEDGFDDDSIHSVHKDPGWPPSHVSVAPRCQFALSMD